MATAMTHTKIYKDRRERVRYLDRISLQQRQEKNRTTALPALVSFEIVVLERGRGRGAQRGAGSKGAEGRGEGLGEQGWGGGELQEE